MEDLFNNYASMGCPGYHGEQSGRSSELIPLMAQSGTFQNLCTASIFYQEPWSSPLLFLHMFLLVDSDKPWWPPSANRSPCPRSSPLLFLHVSTTSWFKSGKPWWPPGCPLVEDKFKPVYWVLRDRELQATVLVVRGTFSMSDVVSCVRLGLDHGAGPEPCTMAIAIDELIKPC